MTPSLRVQDLRVAYDDRVVIDGLDLDIPPGQITAIVGPNACGKSTLLRTLARLLTPKSGGVYLDGRSIHDLPTRQVAQRLGHPAAVAGGARGHDGGRPRRPRPRPAPELVAPMVHFGRRRGALPRWRPPR